MLALFPRKITEKVITNNTKCILPNHLQWMKLYTKWDLEDMEEKDFLLNHRMSFGLHNAPETHSNNKEFIVIYLISSIKNST